MKRLGAALVASLCSIALFGATAANASHSNAFGSIGTIKNGDTVSDNAGPLFFPCIGDQICSVDVVLPNRPYRKFVRINGGTFITLFVPTGSTSRTIQFGTGHGAWAIRVSAFLCDVGCVNFATHTDETQVRVNAVKE